MCAMNGNHQVMQCGEGGRERCGSVGHQPAASKVISHLPFPFLYVSGTLSRNSPYSRFIDENTEAQEREVTCPECLVLEHPPPAQHSSLCSLLPLQRNQTLFLALSSPPASKILESPLWGYFSNFKRQIRIQWSRVGPESHISIKLLSDANAADPWTAL